MKTDYRVGVQSLTSLVNVQEQFLQKNSTLHKKKRVKPEFARFKMKIYWRELRYTDLDKNGQVEYSYDYFYKHIDNEKFRVTDEREGLIELIKEAKKQQRSDNFISVMIWCTSNPEKTTAHSRYDIPVVKIVRNNPQIWYNPTLSFANGKLDIGKIIFVKNAA
jgi:hypothetical protein